MAAKLRQIAHALWFQHFVIGVILASALLAGLEGMPWAHGAARPFLDLAEAVVLAIFTAEQAVRIGAHWPRPWDYFRSPWAWFDFVLVVLSFLPAAHFLSVLRLVRVLRVLRLLAPLHESDVIRAKNAELDAAYHALEREKERSEALLLNVLPGLIADRLKQDDHVIADAADAATVLFSDIVGFTELSARSTPAEMVGLLNDLFTRFDLLSERHGLEKIKTIGDCYMAVAGVPQARPDHAEAIAQMALDLVAEVQAFNAARGTTLQVRTGFHSGPVVAGVIGRKKFIFDLWGDTVNTASRMESHGAPGRVHVTADTAARLGDAWEFEARGEIKVKGKGPMSTFFLVGRRPALVPESADAARLTRPAPDPP